VLSPSNAYESLNRDDDMALKGVFTQIDAILTRRASFVRFLASPRTYFGYLAISLLVLCAYSLPGVAHDLQLLLSGETPTFAFSGLGFGDLWNAANFIYLAWVLITLWRNRSVIYLHPWRERSSFWLRNRDQIMVGIIVGVTATIIASIISFSAGYFFGGQH
jgi:hypothetical protein